MCDIEANLTFRLYLSPALFYTYLLISCTILYALFLRMTVHTASVLFHNIGESSSHLSSGHQWHESYDISKYHGESL